MPNMRFRIASDGKQTRVTNAATGETVTCTRVVFRHAVGEVSSLSLDILSEDIEVDITHESEPDESRVLDVSALSPAERRAILGIVDSPPDS